MLQILGWLGCLMLAVKLTEMGHQPELRDEENKFRSTALNVLLLGWFGVFVFAIWIFMQGLPVEEAYSAEAGYYEDPEVRRQTMCIEAQVEGEPLPSFC